MFRRLASELHERPGFFPLLHPIERGSMGRAHDLAALQTIRAKENAEEVPRLARRPALSFATFGFFATCNSELLVMSSQLLLCQMLAARRRRNRQSYSFITTCNNEDYCYSFTSTGA